MQESRERKTNLLKSFSYLLVRPKWKDKREEADNVSVNHILDYSVRIMRSSPYKFMWMKIDVLGPFTFYEFGFSGKASKWQTSRPDLHGPLVWPGDSRISRLIGLCKLFYMGKNQPLLPFKKIKPNMSCYLFDYVIKSESIFAYSPLNAWSSCGLALWDLYPILSLTLIFVQWVVVIVVNFDLFISL